MFNKSQFYWVYLKTEIKVSIVSRENRFKTNYEFWWYLALIFSRKQARNAEVSRRQVNPPWGTKENFLAHSIEAKSFRAPISNICAKIIKI